MSTNGSAAPFKRPNLSWQPSPEDAWYYKTPATRENPLYTTFVRPWLGHSDDPTFARYDLPWSPREQALRSDPRWNVTERRAYLDGGASDKGKPRAWVFYQVRGLNVASSSVAQGHAQLMHLAAIVWRQVWEAKKPTRDPRADICYCHGISELLNALWHSNASRSD